MVRVKVCEKDPALHGRGSLSDLSWDGDLYHRRKHDGDSPRMIFWLEKWAGYDYNGK